MSRTLNFAFALLFGLILSAAVARAAEHTKDGLNKVKENLAEEKAVLIDVREKKEWDEGHLAAALFVPLSMLADKANDEEYQKELSKKLPKDKVVYCHCRSGRRTLLAADLLQKLGYEVRPLKPGYEDLLEAGFPKAKSETE